MRRIFRRSVPPSVRAIENASRRPTLCFIVRDDENKTGGMIVREKNLPAEIGKTQTPPRSASEVIAEMAAKVAHYPAKPKEEWEGMSAAEMYRRGWEHSEKEEYAEAVKWYRRAAEQGLASAQYALGWMYYKGRGVPQDDAEEAKWYRRAAEQGLAIAQYNLGWMYYKGRGVPQDDAEAVKWYRRAAEQGDDDAQYALGWMYYKGRGVPQDDAEAVKWYRRAAEQGLARAQYNLGMRYSNGRGVPQNDAEAVKWYHRAAEQGHDDAQNALRQLEQKK